MPSLPVHEPVPLGQTRMDVLSVSECCFAEGESHRVSMSSLGLHPQEGLGDAVTTISHHGLEQGSRSPAWSQETDSQVSLLEKNHRCMVGSPLVRSFFRVRALSGY